MTQDLESLYPFLYAAPSNVDDVMAWVRQSTVDKAHEIIALRASVVARDADRLVACATEMADRFAQG
ncbi:phosphoheptose isomerase, partial [Kibdelosporangium lantanae]